jgi:hypothetical protein
LLSLDLDIAFLPFEKNDAHIQKPLFTFERHLQFGDNLVIGTSKKFVSLFFVTPTLLKDDPEIEDIYHALCSGLEDGKKAETTQREAV